MASQKLLGAIEDPPREGRGLAQNAGYLTNQIACNLGVPIVEGTFGFRMKQQSLLSFFSPPAKKPPTGGDAKEGTPATSAKKAPAAKPSAAKATPAKSTPAKSPVAKTTPAKTTPAKTTPAKTTPAKTTPAKTTPAKAEASMPRVELTPRAKPQKSYKDVLGSSSDDDADDDEPLTKKRKRLTKPQSKAIAISDDDEEDEWKEPKDVVMVESDDGSVSLASESEEDVKPIQKKAKTKSPVTKKAPLKAAKAPTKETPPAGSGGTLRQHDAWPWLHAERMDMKKRKPSDPEYDDRTLYLPETFLSKETPAMQQWWAVKRENMDTVLFFKVGKFYELFHMDADIGFKELQLNYMKGEKAHSGFPEKAYAKYSSQLVARGYRVARVEQTETPEMLKARGTKSKVVRREVCSLLSPGTNTISFLDGSTPVLRTGVASYLLALKEEETSYGLCLVDCTTGAFVLGQFDDTRQRDRLRTVLAQFHIAEIVHERHGLSKETKAVLNHGLATSTCVRTELKAGAEMWDATRTVRELKSAAYFAAEAWPSVLLACIDSDGTVKADKALAIGALGGCVWNLRRSLIDHELLSLGQFATYTPPDASSELTQRYVVLDGHTISNLELLRNNYNGTRQGSVLEQLDKTITGFGKRRFEEWLLKPLCHVDEIHARLDAVADLIGLHHSVVSEVRSILKSLPDLERLLSRIHALGSAHRAQTHPDGRAIMYELASYNVRKIKDFVAALNGFKSAIRVVELLRDAVTAPVLTEWVESYPDVSEVLSFFDAAFDHRQALQSGTIQPQAGVDADYDDAANEVTTVLDELDVYLQAQRKALKCKSIVYWGTKREDRFQLEVPESAIGSQQPKAYELKSKKKGFKRFHTPEIRDLLRRLMAAEDRKEDALKDQTRKMFATFDMHYAKWLAAVHALATLDCLISLALISGQSDGYVRPTFVNAAADGPFLEIVDGKHPSIAASVPDFIPNDTTLSGSTPMLLLSGPNMGGKSTLLRQNCILVLMAQMGCYVPATSCALTPVDRIFTRLGASDRILAGQSTLFVELAETATILRHASRHSLVILDELGRGTSTFDGTAIAYAVVEHLLHGIGCRTMFATHYHSLVEEYIENDRVGLGHMDCMVDPDNDAKVVFLYKLADGICPKSYGLNVATLAELPDDVITLAGAKSAEFEDALKNTFACSELQSAVRNAAAASDGAALRALWTNLA
ncbi:hypothetical protein SDRG_08747 [Saprolegnia diclina VS20]|uniref:DNA mismatch repair protein n=1 Tax=Saprolegnia diclina (strain VS20) TaxID=1156394 RepID=T0RMS4_SAPDV|nr:hypothetical protein SDRG_08747 [Saprolegnia diclina VS20]EQC33643.1 hypothetical protein SDRG_08747 [Saprolegnia diclina VS20]|eukprot:XP_008612866.1 hypothetical protein SDRG_08747 [Saprolegnia diclina VS20]